MFLFSWKVAKETEEENSNYTIKIVYLNFVIKQVSYALKEIWKRYFEGKGERCGREGEKGAGEESEKKGNAVSGNIYICFFLWKKQ